MKLLKSLLLLSLISVSTFAHLDRSDFNEETKVTLDRAGEHLMIRGSWETIKGFGNRPNSFRIDCYKSKMECHEATSNISDGKVITRLSRLKLTNWSQWKLEMERVSIYSKKIITYDVRAGSVTSNSYDSEANTLNISQKIRNRVERIERN